MEKEEKIQQAAEKQSFFGKLKEWFGVIAFTLMSLIKVGLVLIFGVQVSAYSLVYPIVCLKIAGGDIGTAFITAIVQGLINTWLFGQSSITFELLFCFIFTIIYLGLKQSGFEDNIFLNILTGSFLFAAMVSTGLFDYGAI